MDGSTFFVVHNPHRAVDKQPKRCARHGIRVLINEEIITNYSFVIVDINCTISSQDENRYL